MSELAAIVDVEALAETAVAALVAGLAVTLLFSLAIRGTTRASELRRDGRSVAALAAGALGVAALLGTFAAVAVGLIVMIRG